MERDELVQEIARLQGFARIGPDIRSTLEEVIDSRLLRRTELDHLGRMRLRVDRPN